MKSNSRGARQRYDQLMVLLIEKQNNLLRAYLKRFPKSADFREGRRLGNGAFEKGMAPENGWLTVADVESPPMMNDRAIIFASLGYKR